MTIRTTANTPGWLRGISSANIVSGVPAQASSICHDSRQAGPGAVFVAVVGLNVDGHAYIANAIAAGARSIVVQADQRDSWQHHVATGVTFIAVPDTRVALAEASAGFYDNPARALGMIGVTGTDGKTTTTHLIAHVLNEAGRLAGHLSSVEFTAGTSVELNASHMTTLESPEIQRHLAKIRDGGARYAVVEVSSIGLDMHRVDQCEFDVGVFTNLAPDHLDYHHSMEVYREAKAILFRMLGTSREKGFAKAAILNADDPVSTVLRGVTAAPVTTYGLHAHADIVAHDITQHGFGTRFKAAMLGREADVATRLLGDYNVSNCLAAAATAVSQGVPFHEALQSLASFPGVPGRMELLDEGQPFRVVVDIASTEQSMRNVLRMLRPITIGKLIVLFGAAGERDTARRGGIARAVAEGADHAVITNEDPRREDPDQILDEIGTALESAGFGGKFDREPDRQGAIELAFKRARKGDTVLLAGKGTETSIVIGATHLPWDERGIARKLLQSAFGGV